MNQASEAESRQPAFYKATATVLGNGIMLDKSDLRQLAGIYGYGIVMSLLDRSQDREELAKRGIAVGTEKYRGSRLYFDENSPPSEEDRAKAISQIDNQKATNIAKFLLSQHDEGPKIPYEE